MRDRPSPTPWRLRYSEDRVVPEAFGTHEIVDANGDPVWVSFHPNEQEDRRVEAAPDSMKRIVACVNALAGIPAKYLDSIRTVVDILRGIVPDEHINPDHPTFEATFSMYSKRMCRALQRGVQIAKESP